MKNNKGNPLSNEEIRLINSTMDLRDDKITKQCIEIDKVWFIELK